MWKTKKMILVTITKDSSRKEARELMRKLRPDVDWHSNCVHHIDQNPFNNDLNNLAIINNSEHTYLHSKLKKPETIKKTQTSGIEMMSKALLTNYFSYHEIH